MSDIRTLLNRLGSKTIDFTALDYDKIANELIEYYKSTGKWRGIQDDISEGDVAKFIIDFLAYAVNLATFRIDFLSNELYLPTALHRRSIINILRLFNIKVPFYKSSVVSLTLTTNISNHNGISINPLVPINVNGIIFTLMKSPYDYHSVIEIPPGISEYSAYAVGGRYIQEQHRTVGDVVNITTQNPVSDGSLKVALVTDSTIDKIADNYLRTVDNILDADTLSYTYYYDENGKAHITIGNKLSFVPPPDHIVIVEYITDGGSNTNIPAGSINANLNLIDNSNNNVTVTITNPQSAVGGSDPEDLESVKLRAPLLIRSNERAVTTDDVYIIIKSIPNVRDVFVVDKHMDINIYNNFYNVPIGAIFIYVLPKSGGSISPDLRMLIADELERRRIVATNYFIFEPRYIPFSIIANVNVLPTYSKVDVISKINSKLKSTYSQLKFKSSIYTSQIISDIQSVEGVRSVLLQSPNNNLIVNDHEVLYLTGVTIL